MIDSNSMDGAAFVPLTTDCYEALEIIREE